jgi:hypothetical protein
MRRPHPRPWHRGSEFGDGPRRRLDREQRARFRFLVNAHHRVGRITRAHRDVGLALLKRLSDDGRCDPSHATLADDVGSSARTVGRATAAMRAVGLLRWTMRLVRAGWRAEQTSNAYELVPTAAPPCGGQTGRETRRIDISLGALDELLRAAAAAPDLLLRRRRQMAARFAG